MEVTFFESAPGFRAWLEQQQHTTQELWVGFYKKSSGRPSITWPEEEKSGIYAYEQRNTAELNEAYEQQFRANKKAWDFFQTQPPS